MNLTPPQNTIADHCENVEMHGEPDFLRAFAEASPVVGRVHAKSTLVMPSAWLAILILTCGLITLALPSSIATSFVLVSAATIAGAFLVDILTLPSRAAISFSRRLKEIYPLGHRTRFDIAIATRQLAITARLVQTGTRAFEVLIPEETAEPPGGFQQYVKARSSDPGRATYELRPRQRGRHRFPPAILLVAGKLHLAVKRFVFDHSDEIHVYPDLDQVKRAELTLLNSRFLETGLKSKKFVGEGTEFESLREYHPDDDIRHINWHATARHRRPITNQYRIERNQSVITLIDCGRLMSTPVGTTSRLDIALANAAGVASVCRKLEDRVGAIAFDSTIRAEIRPRRAKVQTYLSALYDIETSLEESDFALAFARVASYKRALIIVFTDLLDHAAARPMISALPALLVKHQVIVASVRDPEIDELAEITPRTPSEAYQQASAISALDRRAAPIRNLVSLGVDVVEALPNQMTPALIDSYLKLKARMRL